MGALITLNDAVLSLFYLFLLLFLSRAALPCPRVSITTSVFVSSFWNPSFLGFQSKYVLLFKIIYIYNYLKKISLLFHFPFAIFGLKTLVINSILPFSRFLPHFSYTHFPSMKCMPPLLSPLNYHLYDCVCISSTILPSYKTNHLGFNFK